jgi:hypothetical protein
MSQIQIPIDADLKVFRRTFEVGPVEFYRIQLGFILPGLNNTLLTVLAFLYHHGAEEAQKRILNRKIFTSRKSYDNVITQLRKDGLLLGFHPDIRLHADIKLCDQDNVTLLVLKRDETKDAIGHRYYQEGSSSARTS